MKIDASPSHPHPGTTGDAEFPCGCLSLGSRPACLDAVAIDARAYEAAERLSKRFGGRKAWFVAASVRHVASASGGRTPVLSVYVSRMGRRARRLERGGFMGFDVVLIEVVRFG